MWLPPLDHSEMEHFFAALESRDRHTQFRAKLYSKDGDPLPTPLTLLDGAVDVDATDQRNSPSRTAEIVLLDPKHQIEMDWLGTVNNDVWFSKLIGLFWDVWVPQLDRWVPIPVFRGPIYRPSRKGAEITVSAYGKDAQHLDPYLFHKSVSYRRHMRTSGAIKQLFEDRGETDFRFDHAHERLGRDLTRLPGQEPWKTGQSLAKSINRQLFYDAQGTLVLRKLPDAPVYRYKEGSDSLLLEPVTEDFSIERVRDLVVVRGERHEKVKVWKGQMELDQKASVGDGSIHLKNAPNIDHLADGLEIRIGGRGGGTPEAARIDDSYSSGSRTVPLRKDLKQAHGVGAPVEVYVEIDRTIRIYARDDLPDSHPMSAQSLTGGKRHRVRIIDRPNVHRRERAQEVAERELDDIKKGVELELPLETVPLPLLEELDPIAAEADGRVVRSKARSFTIPLNESDSMSVNSGMEKRAKRKTRKQRHR